MLVSVDYLMQPYNELNKPILSFELHRYLDILKFINKTENSQYHHFIILVQSKNMKS